ncbi:hypothetical protein D3C80_1359710 [compost metagenome]
MAGIVVVDQVGEFLAVRGRAARIDRQHGVARRREQLIVGGEVRTIGGEGAAVDF